LEIAAATYHRWRESPVRSHESVRCQTA
jgi:hypothetical protein